MIRSILICFVALALLPLACYGQSNESTIDGLDWHAVVVGGTSAEFIFPLTGRAKYSWHNEETPENQLEYGWTVDVVDDGRGYQFGASLFHYSEAANGSGTLAELMEVCQHDLWRVSKDSGDNIGSFGRTDVVDRRVRFRIEKEMVEKIFAGKPEHVRMTVVMPDCSVNKKVVVTYKK